jgi:hypothetical protein
LADKTYFKTNKLSPAIREAIFNITHGDNFTFLVTGFYFHMVKFQNNFTEVDSGSIKLSQQFYNFLKEYNKNLFPVPGKLEDYSLEGNNFHLLSLFGILRARNYLVKAWVELPSLIQKALKNSLYDFIYNIPDNQYSNSMVTHNMKESGKKVEEIGDVWKQVPNKKKQELFPKLFNSNTNFLKVAEYIGEIKKKLMFYNYDAEMSSEDVIATLEMCQKSKLVFNKKNVMVIKVGSGKDMQKLGCMSSWCFAVPGDREYWNDYASRGYVYIIFDFNLGIEDGRFMMTFLPSSY